jgi:hypothetical protein
MWEVGCGGVSKRAPPIHALDAPSGHTLACRVRCARVGDHEGPPETARNAPERLSPSPRMFMGLGKNPKGQEASVA